MKIITDEKRIHELLTRGVEEVIGIEDLKEKLLSGKKLRIKLGIDPTSPNLHLGRTVPLLKLRDFQELGHKVIFIVGDFTALVGDTSDKDSERPMLSQKTVKENLKSYRKQVGKIIDLKKADFKFNGSWLKKLDYIDIGEQANIFSINQFISRENIKKRLDEGKRVSLREVLYPLMQGYDSVVVKSDVEIGGTDQKFNILAGRDMQRHFGQPPQNIITGPLVEGTDGRKMSSSWGNTINLFDIPNDIYGKIMSVRDNLVVKYFNLFTRVSLEKIKEIEKQFSDDPKGTKQKLAWEIVRMYHDEKKADAAQTNWQETFSKGGIPEDIQEIVVAKGQKLKDILVKNKIIKSNSEFVRLLKALAIKDTKTEEKITQDLAITSEKIIKIGKRTFVKIIVK